MVIYYTLINSGINRLGLKNISFETKSSKEIKKIVDHSCVVLDINDRNQTGLTLRTIETVLSKKKLITTNQDIKNYDFYRKENILIIDRKNINISEDFFKEKYIDISDEVLKKYTVGGWVEDVFISSRKEW